MKFCQAYGCDKRATCHGVLCLWHYVMARPSLKIQAISDRRASEDFAGDKEMQRLYVSALDALVADVNRQLTPPAGAMAARPEPKGPAGSFAGSAFSTPPPRNRVEEI